MECAINGKQSLLEVRCLVLSAPHLRRRPTKAVLGPPSQNRPKLLVTRETESHDPDRQKADPQLPSCPVLHQPSNLAARQTARLLNTSLPNTSLLMNKSLSLNTMTDLWLPSRRLLILAL